MDLLIAVGGPAADGFIDGAVAAGFPAEHTRRFADSVSASQPVAAEIRPGDLVPVKGSRGTRMDVISDALQAEGTR